MWIDVFLAISGFCAGSAVSCGVFAILVKLGVFTRIVEFLREAKNIRLLESFMVFGGIAGNLITVFTFDLPFGTVGLIIAGFFWGMYIGWLNMALAETLSMFSVVFRRIKLKYGLGITIIFIALGKLAGSMFYFYKKWGI